MLVALKVSVSAGHTRTFAPMQSVAAFFFIALPWLNPFSFGPSPSVVQWLFTLGSLAFFLLLAPRVRLADVAASAWLAAALLSSLIGLLQYFGATALFGPWVDNAGVGEAFANLRQRNQFATLTSIGLAALLWCVAQRQSLPAAPVVAVHLARRGRSLVIFMAAAALLAVGNAASSSRTGLVQLVLLTGFTFMWGGSRKLELRWVVLAALLAYGIAALVLPLLAGLNPHATGILVRLHDGDSLCGSRLTLWANVLHLIAQKPWLGWGWGELDFAHFITLYPGARFCDILDNAHNLPLHLAVELGVPLALALCVGAAWLTWRAKPWLERDATRQLAWTVLAVILLHSMLEYPLWYGPFQVAFGLSLWLLWRAPVGPNSRSGGVRRLTSGQSALAATLIATMVAYAGWDYHRISQIYLSPAMRAEGYRDNTLEKIQNSWLFQNSVRFAELTVTRLTRDNAAHIHLLAIGLLHFSPEAAVVEKCIESAALLGNDDEAQFYRVRYQAAFPDTYALWAARQPPEKSALGTSTSP
jgi:O-antigen ligase